ncbi:MAG: putative cytochrome c [Gemmatimonadetes bacterium]|nr:putative cytochrome c [Gemmatimonadota bacterium]
MRVSRWSTLGWAAMIVGCASAAATNVRAPLGARLTPGAKTGAPVPLRSDPTARVILSSAPGLPPASYAPSQAARGEKVYVETCGQCHQPAQFVGQNFVESWNDRRVYDFYALVRGTMPLDNPGGLKEQEYIDVVAYLLKANNAAPGLDSLRADTTALRAHKIAVRAP